MNGILNTLAIACEPDSMASHASRDRVEAGDGEMRRRHPLPARAHDLGYDFRNTRSWRCALARDMVVGALRRGCRRIGEMQLVRRVGKRLRRTATRSPAAGASAMGRTAGRSVIVRPRRSGVLECHGEPV